MVEHFRGFLLVIHYGKSVVDNESCEVVVDEEGEALSSALLTKYSVAISLLHYFFHDFASDQTGHQRK